MTLDRRLAPPRSFPATVSPNTLSRFVRRDVGRRDGAEFGLAAVAAGAVAIAGVG